MKNLMFAVFFILALKTNAEIVSLDGLQITNSGNLLFEPDAKWSGKILDTKTRVFYGANQGKLPALGTKVLKGDNIVFAPQHVNKEGLKDATISQYKTCGYYKVDHKGIISGLKKEDGKAVASDPCILRARSIQMDDVGEPESVTVCEFNNKSCYSVTKNYCASIFARSKAKSMQDFLDFGTQCMRAVEAEAHEKVNSEITGRGIKNLQKRVATDMNLKERTYNKPDTNLGSIVHDCNQYFFQDDMDRAEQFVQQLGLERPQRRQKTRQSSGVSLSK